MKKIILGIFVVLSACSVTSEKKEVSNETANAGMRQGGRKDLPSLLVYDETDYSGTINKAYFVVTPVMRYKGEHYLVRNTWDVQLKYKLEDMHQGYVLKLSDYSDIQRTFIPKNGSKKIEFTILPYYSIVGYLVWYMDPLYTGLLPCAIGVSRPTDFKPTTGTLADYIQKLEYYSNEIIIAGHYRYKFLFVDVDSYLLQDR